MLLRKRVHPDTFLGCFHDRLCATTQYHFARRLVEPCPNRAAIPDDLYPVGRWVDEMERRGEISPARTSRWKEGIFGLMLLWGLEPDDLVTISDSR